MDVSLCTCFPIKFAFQLNFFGFQLNFFGKHVHFNWKTFTQFFFAATHCNTLQHTATHRNTMQHATLVRHVYVSMRCICVCALYMRRVRTSNHVQTPAINLNLPNHICTPQINLNRTCIPPIN